jgi:N-(2-amino-2-carboxyethyl)-L-glutamate synthase
MTTLTRADVPIGTLREFGRAVGRTPIATLEAEVAGRPRTIVAKLESRNLCGSIKARTAFSLVRSVFDRGVDPNAVLVESTSGNVGIALGFIARMLGVRFIAVVDPKLSPVVREKIEEQGAEIVQVNEPDPQGGYLLSRIDRVAELCRTMPGAVWVNQYSNPANPEIHYRQTGPEIYHQTWGDADAIFVAASTGGTLAGIARYFRERKPRTKLVGVDAVGSIIFTDEPGPRRLTGIGASRKSDFLTPDCYDDYVLVNDERAFAFCHAVHEQTGLSVGGSSGAVFAGCTSYLARHPEIETPVCICADSGESYARTIFNDRWLAEQRVHLDDELLSPVEGAEPVSFSGDVEVEEWS